MKILFDTSVILDILLDRQPFSEDAAALLSCAERGDIAGYAAVTTITTLARYYLCAKAGGKVKAKRSSPGIRTYSHSRPSKASPSLPRPRAFALCSKA